MRVNCCSMIHEDAANFFPAKIMAEFSSCCHSHKCYRIPGCRVSFVTDCAKSSMRSYDCDTLSMLVS